MSKRKTMVVMYLHPRNLVAIISQRHEHVTDASHDRLLRLAGADGWRVNFDSGLACAYKVVERKG